MIWKVRYALRLTLKHGCDWRTAWYCATQSDQIGLPEEAADEEASYAANDAA